MAHRSNQAVASQDQAATQPPDDGPPQRRRHLVGWVTALAALGVSTGLVGAGLWFTRLSIAELLIGAALSERGADADFDVVSLDFNHARLHRVRFGAGEAPDAAIKSVEARWAWRGIVPSLTAVRLTEPRLRLRLDAGGRLSAGALDRVQGGAPSPRRPALPEIEIEIIDGQALIEAPFGALTAHFAGAGVLGANFTAQAAIAETTVQNGAYALEAGAAALSITTREGVLSARLTANASALRWDDFALDAAALRIIANTPMDLARAEAEAAWRVGRMQSSALDVETFAGVISGQAQMRDDALAPLSWSAQAGAGAGRANYNTNAINAPRLEARAEGGEFEGGGEWRFESARFEGFSLIAEQPSASGTFTMAWRDGFTADAPVRVTLGRAQLDGRGRARLRAILPNLPQAPIGPTFAAAEDALDRAAARFDLVLPLRLTANGQTGMLLLERAAEAQAASGARLRLAPLRRDAPAFALELPSLALRGAAALELAGGGAPTLALLLDTIAWAPQAAFDADGTLSLENWGNDGAEIDAPELGVSMTISPGGAGQLDVRGPATITGPLGDGQVRALSTNLELAISWGEGWAVRPTRECLPITLGGLDVAGLSFAGGRFALCAQNQALIRADARGNLGGGFQIEALTLSGRMAGENGQPARLQSRRLTGDFGGVSGNIRLAMAAEAPTLTIDMSDDRVLSLVMARLTANARIDESWAIEGQFERGGLTDPALPGVVSAIAGRWSAAPENNKPVIRVAAGAARLEANRPASDKERPLFNPMRLAGVSAVFADGVIDAEGAVQLDASGRQLARFAAHHVVSDGLGVARIDAPNLSFDEGLQPYDISELARGVVDNVRGPASGQALVTWTRDAMQSNARIALDGVSLASATIPLIGDVRGEIYFDDLFKLTTPPGQEVSVGVLNPGVAVTNGRVRLQLREAGVIAIEHAEFAFAGGVLAMRPEVIRLGADETNIELTLRDVDAAALIAQLNVPDLQATGTIEGAFPLRLTRQNAIVTNGVLRASGGGRIAYTGAAGEATEGVTRVAFDALRDFRYEALGLTLNGDLNGEVVSDIIFSGENVGEPIDLSPLASLPGVSQVRMLGVPFRFNVKVTAPFRRLADTAGAIIDPGSLIRQGNQARDQENNPEINPEVDPEVDPGPQPPR